MFKIYICSLKQDCSCVKVEVVLVVVVDIIEDKGVVVLKVQDIVLKVGVMFLSIY